MKLLDRCCCLLIIDNCAIGLGHHPSHPLIIGVAAATVIVFMARTVVTLTRRPFQHDNLKFKLSVIAVNHNFLQYLNSSL